MSVKKIYNSLELSNQFGTSGYPEDDEFKLVGDFVRSVMRYLSTIFIKSVANPSIKEEMPRILEFARLYPITAGIAAKSPIAVAAKIIDPEHTEVVH